MRQQNVCSHSKFQLLFFTIQPSEHVVFITLESISLFSKFFSWTILSKVLLFFYHTRLHTLFKEVDVIDQNRSTNTQGYCWPSWCWLSGGLKRGCQPLAAHRVYTDTAWLLSNSLWNTPTSTPPPTSLPLPPLPPHAVVLLLVSNWCLCKYLCMCQSVVAPPNKTKTTPSPPLFYFPYYNYYYFNLFCLFPSSFCFFSALVNIVYFFKYFFCVCLINPLLFTSNT